MARVTGYNYLHLEIIWNHLHGREMTRVIDPKLRFPLPSSWAYFNRWGKAQHCICRYAPRPWEHNWREKRRDGSCDESCDNAVTRGWDREKGH